MSIAQLEPRAVWQIFADMTAVPRPSKREEKIRAHVRSFADRHKLTCTEDATGNILISVPPSAGCADAPTIVLQAHLDMVCEANRGTTIDFDNDPIPALLDPNGPGGRPIVRAEGTTLGADNGIGVALALAAATSPDVTHGPLEILLTIDEEAGMTGAKLLTPSSFSGRILLNLDSEEDDVLYIGCAGGCDTNLSWSLNTEAPAAGCQAAEIHVQGLRGGHSGCDIQENRGNAIKLLTRTLLGVDAEIQLAEVHGGSKRNAIPREARAVLAASDGALKSLYSAAREVSAAAQQESNEPGLSIEIVSSAVPDAVLSIPDSARLLAALAALPSGVVGMSTAVSGLVQTSNNLSTVSSSRANGRLEVVAGALTRSSSDSRLAETCQQIAAVGRLAGAAIETGNDYPGWEPNPQSAVLDKVRKVYERVFEVSPDVTAIHAGLECGIIGQRVGDMDMVSFGPTIEGADSPDERVYVDSVEKIWSYLKAVLHELAG